MPRPRPRPRPRPSRPHHLQPRRSRALLLASVLLLGVVPATPVVAAAPPVLPTLVGVRAAHHPTFDRVVFDFRGGVPQRHDVSHVPELVADGSGDRVAVPGRAVLQVVFSAVAHEEATGRPTVASRFSFALPNVVSVVRAGDFEGLTTYGIGLARSQPYRVFTLHDPDRVVVDVDAAFRTTTRRVWFVDEGRVQRGEVPHVVPVDRQVLPWTPATGVLDRLFAGPTAAEQARGLRLVASGATGFEGLVVSGGTARFRLTGGCAGGGSTVTVADEVLPSLHQFPTVSTVKIHDPAGGTARPEGPVDSVPECLEP